MSIQNISSSTVQEQCFLSSILHICGQQTSRIFTPISDEERCSQLTEIFLRAVIILSVVIPIIGMLVNLYLKFNSELHEETDDMQKLQYTIRSELPIKTIAMHTHALQIFKNYHSKYIPLKDDQSYISPGQHPWKNQQIFKDADFFVRHGLMHHSHVALLIPILVEIYQVLGNSRALRLSSREIDMLQIGALFHDYGRLIKQSDLTDDEHDMEKMGANACYEYLIQHFNATHDEANTIKQSMMEKDSKNNAFIFQILLHEADCLAVLRADDWEFKPKYLFLWEETKNNPDKRTLLHACIEANKRFLVEIGDSPYDLKTLSGEIIQGRFDLKQKETFEKDPYCFSRLSEIFRKHVGKIFIT